MIPGMIPLLAIDVRKICATVNDLHLYDAQEILGPAAEPRESRNWIRRQDSKNICTLPKIDSHGSNVVAVASEISSVHCLRLRQPSHLHYFMIDHRVEIRSGLLIIKV